MRRFQVPDVILAFSAVRLNVTSQILRALRAVSNLNSQWVNSTSAVEKAM